MSSLDSANGPSVTLGFPPENLRRVPFAGGCSPSSPSSTPALVRDSLYFVILATRSAGGVKSAAAFSYPFGITSIMNRIVVSPRSSGSEDLRIRSIAPEARSMDTTNGVTRKRQGLLLGHRALG